MNFVYVDGHRGGLLLGQVGAEGSRKHGARCRCGSRQDIASSVRRVLDGRARRHPHPSRGRRSTVLASCGASVHSQAAYVIVNEGIHRC